MVPITDWQRVLANRLITDPSCYRPVWQAFGRQCQKLVLNNADKFASLRRSGRSRGSLSIQKKDESVCRNGRSPTEWHNQDRAHLQFN